jgi:hypothetical protein
MSGISRTVAGLGLRISLCIAACAALGACASRANVDASANVPARYTNVWITVNELWINARATAGPDDTDWLKFPLRSPVTVNLAATTNGALTLLATQLHVPAGEYGQLRLYLAEASAQLTSSAQSAAISFNDEVDYVDGNGHSQQVPLRLANPEKGIGIPITLKVPTSASAILSGIGSTSTTTPATTTGTTTATATTGATPPALATAVIDFDAARDLVPVLFSAQAGFFLNPHLTAIDLAHVGTIQGQVDVSAIAADAITGRREVEVTAETMSSDGTRHVIVKSAPVRSDGSFALYPFSTASGEPTTYDLVIHGPLVQTVIVKSVPPTAGAPTSAAAGSLGSIVLTAATSFPVNVLPSSPIAVRGARVCFYQTPSGSGEVPYLIEERAADPFSGLFASDQALSTGAIAVGTFVSNQTPVLTTVTPVEGAAAYAIATSAASFDDANLGETVKAPTPISSNPTLFTAPLPTVPATASADSVAVTVNVASPGRYDRGALIITRDGAIVTATSLDTALEQNQPSVNLSLADVPGGSATTSFAAGVYFAEVWVWSSSDPTGTLSRQPYSAAIDLSTGSASGITIDIT